jgi:hypothetical protein
MIKSLDLLRTAAQYALVLGCVGLFSSTLWAQTAGLITYQGELRSAGTAADGNYDFQFHLYNQAAGGASVAAPEFVNNVAVDEGLFSAQLDFGSMPFENANLWLEIHVKAAGSSQYTVLAPRQALTAAPYAMHANIVGANGVVSGSIQDGSVTAADIASNAVGSSEIISNQVQQRVSGSCPAGQAMVSVAENGSVNCAAVSASSTWNENAVSNNIWTPHNVSVGGDGQLGLGSFTVFGPFNNDFGGMYVNVNGADGSRPFYGYAVNSEIRAWTQFNEEANTYSVVVDNQASLYLDANGNMGVGQSDPSYKLDVDGDARISDLAYAESAPSAPVYTNSEGRLITGPREHVYSVGPADFNPSNSNTPYTVASNRQEIYIEAGSGGLNAGVHLPQGATVTSVEAFFVDNEDPHDLTITLRRSRLSASGENSMAFISTVGIDSPAIMSLRDDSIINSIIDNEQYSYFVRVFSTQWIIDSQRFRGAIIRYTL